MEECRVIVFGVDDTEEVDLVPAPPKPAPRNPNKKRGLKLKKLKKKPPPIAVPPTVWTEEMAIESDMKTAEDTFGFDEKCVASLIPEWEKRIYLDAKYALCYEWRKVARRIQVSLPRDLIDMIAKLCVIIDEDVFVPAFAYYCPCSGCCK